MEKCNFFVGGVCKIEVRDFLFFAFIGLATKALREPSSHKKTDHASENPPDLGGNILDLAGKIPDLGGNILDLPGNILDLGGKILDLELKILLRPALPRLLHGAYL